jgi:segregation and condensation protein A
VTQDTLHETELQGGADPEAGDFIVDEATDHVLRLHLESFQGPMEVLLYLIKAQEVDIFDIPISTITDQYLKFLELVEGHQLDVAGDYLVMAATLIQIKAKMLIPADIDVDDEEETEEEDPRLELVEKLIQYRMYKDAAARLAALEEERANWYTRNVKPEADLLHSPEGEETDFLEVSLFDVAQAFKGVMRFLHEDRPHTIELEGSSVDEKIEYIQTLLDMQPSVGWVDLFHLARNRVEAICFFLAILELCRMNAVSLHQHAAFGEIRLFKKKMFESNAA